MKRKIWIPTEVEISSVFIDLPVRFGDEDMAYDAPLRTGDNWCAEIDINTGMIVNWPLGKTLDLYLKVVDEGMYFLYDDDGHEIASIEGGYVPHGLIPGDWGDYVSLNINEQGLITNWPKQPNLDAFFPDRN